MHGWASGAKGPRLGQVRKHEACGPWQAPTASGASQLKSMRLVLSPGARCGRVSGGTRRGCADDPPAQGAGPNKEPIRAHREMSLAGGVVSNRSAGAKPPFFVCWNSRGKLLLYSALSIAHLCSSVKSLGPVRLTSGALPTRMFEGCGA
jgi:hypothetical protein